MRSHAEEDPDEDPDEPDEEPAHGGLHAATATVAGPGRDAEYRSESIKLSELGDGTSLAGKLTAASAEGWDFVQIVEGAGDARMLLFRRPKQADRPARPVGFAPPARS